MIFRIMGALCVMLGCFFFSCSFVVRQRACRMSLEEIVVLISEIQAEIKYSRTTEAGMRKSIQERYCLRYIDLGSCNALRNLQPPDALSARQKSQFSHCFDSVGCGGSQKQYELFSRYRAYFEQELSTAREREKQIARVYPAMGLGLGLMLALVCI